jgi:hypothetical protein
MGCYRSAAHIHTHIRTNKQAINTKRAQIVSATTTEEPVTQHATTCVPKLHDTTAAKFATHNSKECFIIVQYHSLYRSQQPLIKLPLRHRECCPTHTTSKVTAATDAGAAAEGSTGHANTPNATGHAAARPSTGTDERRETSPLSREAASATTTE